MRGLLSPLGSSMAPASVGRADDAGGAEAGGVPDTPGPGCSGASSELVEEERAAEPTDPILASRLGGGLGKEGEDGAGCSPAREEPAPLPATMPDNTAGLRVRRGGGLGISASCRLGGHAAGAADEAILNEDVCEGVGVGVGAVGGEMAATLGVGGGATSDAAGPVGVDDPAASAERQVVAARRDAAGSASARGCSAAAASAAASAAGN